MTKLRGILSKSPNIADFLHLDINEVQARCLLITQQVGRTEGDKFTSASNRNSWDKKVSAGEIARGGFGTSIQ